MQDLSINVTEIEEWQTIEDTASLDKIFMKAQQVLTGGGTVHLIRKHHSGQCDKFDEITTLEDLSSYKERVFKYLM